MYTHLSLLQWKGLSSETFYVNLFWQVFFPGTSVSSPPLHSPHFIIPLSISVKSPEGGSSFLLNEPNKKAFSRFKVPSQKGTNKNFREAFSFRVFNA